MSFQGLPCWYELCTQDADAAIHFYSTVIGWSCKDAGMPNFTYILAGTDEEMVAGIFNPGEPMPSFWMTYFAVDDCAATCAKITSLGGSVHKEPANIPGTGTFAIVVDPAGAAFGLLQPLPGGTGSAYHPHKPRHGQWHQLQTPDTAAALEFYSQALGWTQVRTFDMGDLGPYRIVSAQGQEMGGVMGMMSPSLPPHWMPFFGVASVSSTISLIEQAGGKVVSGPDPVPGDIFVATAQDDRGIFFSIVGNA